MVKWLRILFFWDMTLYHILESLLKIILVAHKNLAHHL